MDLSRQKDSLSIISALVSAVHEWLLIFMLFIDASFSYFVTRFARRCHLQIPCLLCSRLDHVLGKEKPDFVWNLMCNDHKSKISSLVLCRLHKNLVDVHGTCESCFFSFAMINNSNAGTHGLLVGKLADEPHYELVDYTSTDKCDVGSRNTRKCCCCNEQWILRTPSQKLFHSKSSDSDKPELDSPIILASKCTSVELHESREESPQWHHLENNETDPLSHIRYEKVKISSDSDSEAQISDDETADTVIGRAPTSEQVSSAMNLVPEPQIIAASVYPASEKSIQSLHPSNLSLLEPDGSPSSGSNEKIEEQLEHGLKELNWPQSVNKNCSHTPSGLISFTEALLSSDVAAAPFHEDRAENPTNIFDLEHKVTVENREVTGVVNDSTSRTELMKEIVESGETPRVESESVAANETQPDSKRYAADASSLAVDSLDLGDAYRLALGSRGRQLSGKLLEQQMSMQESKRASEDLKILLSQISAVRIMDVSLNDISPRLYANGEDYISTDGSNSAQNLHRRISLERNESNLSLEWSAISETEGESVVDRLRRQVEHDKKIMGALYKELEEERNASAIAANQAMAMITRLQEEKASIHMEALQHLRMMEEQAEYDGEAFQRVNELLGEKDKQIQDLEAEIEQSKNAIEDLASPSNYLDESSLSDARKLKAGKLEEDQDERSTASHCRLDYNHTDIDKPDGSPKMFKDTDSGKVFKHHFENKKNYILQSLKKLEEKLVVFSDMNNCDSTPHQGLDTDASLEHDGLLPSREDGQMRNYSLLEEAVINRQVPASLHISNTKHELNVLRSELSAISKLLEVLDIEQYIINGSILSLDNGGEESSN